MEKWEYANLDYDADVKSDVLNKLGEQGWKLITVINDDMNCRWIFGREKVEEVIPDGGD